MVLHGKIPVMAEIQIPNGQGREVFFISGGITGDVRLQTHTKLVYHANNEREKKKKRGDMGLPRLRYGYMARAGHGSFSLYATYNPRPMFKDGEGPKIHPYSVGVMLNF
ncbi:MAG: WG repeat-containing protein, partial [Marinilabilia sp.]